MTGCVACGAPTPNTRCQTCRVGDRDYSGECSKCGCDVVLVEICDDCSASAKSARTITGPDADDQHFMGGDEQ